MQGGDVFFVWVRAGRFCTSALHIHMTHPILSPEYVRLVPLLCRSAASRCLKVTQCRKTCWASCSLLLTI
jgi:hypothetical protein